MSTTVVDTIRPTEASRTPPFWVVRRMQPGLQIKIRGHFFRHETRAAAEAEAIRLAHKFPGARFVVLEAVSAISISEDGKTLDVTTTPARNADAIVALDPAP